MMTTFNFICRVTMRIAHWVTQRQTLSDAEADNWVTQRQTGVTQRQTNEWRRGRQLSDAEADNVQLFMLKIWSALPIDAGIHIFHLTLHFFIFLSPRSLIFVPITPSPSPSTSSSLTQSSFVLQTKANNSKQGSAPHNLSRIFYHKSDH